MLEFSETLGSKDPRKFSPQEVIEFRRHGSKATLTSLATHLEIDRRWIRHQGAWKGDREDLMPDNYLRDTQRPSLRLQEKCMAHLREGGDMMELQTCPVTRTPNASAIKPGLDGSRVKAKRPFVNTLGFNHQIGVPTPSSTSSESDPEVPDDLVLDPEAEEVKFVAAKLFILNASTGLYHLVDFSESLLNPDKWAPPLWSEIVQGLCNLRFELTLPRRPPRKWRLLPQVLPLCRSGSICGNPLHAYLRPPLCRRDLHKQVRRGSFNMFFSGPCLLLPS
jgi:hypothetical protein